MEDEMSQIGRTGALVAITLLIASAAAARDGQTADPPAMPRWDTDATIGLLNTSDRAGDRDDGNGWDNGAMAAYGFGVGYFWTQHLKSDVGVTLTHVQYAFDAYTYPSPDVPPGAVAFGNRTSRFTALSGALTYQFFENTFVHPYVSGGVRLGWIDEHRSREQTTMTVGGVRHTIPALDDRDASLLARPIAAVGCKSYFNARTFVRTEALAAFGSNGVSQTTFRIGAGFDF
jgi:hypothetical protein